MKLILPVALAILVLVMLPLGVPEEWVTVLSKMLIAGLFAMAFNLLSGQAGMLSFGHAAYFGVGTFATLHLMQAAESGLAVPTPLLPAAGLLAGLVVGAICGLFATLRSGVYFSMITLAIAELFFNLAPNLEGVFGGEGGLSSFRMPWLGLTFGNDLEVYYLVACWTVAAAAVLFLYTATPFGRLTVALRENDQRVRFLGYNSYLSRVLIFSISSMFAGLAGGLYAVVNESANYVLFETGASASVVWAAFIGGTNIFVGPAIGAALLTGFTHLVSDSTPLVLLYQGLLFIIVMVFCPNGIVGTIAGWAMQATSARFYRLLGPVSVMAAAVASVTLVVVFTVEITARFFSAEQRVSAAGIPHSVEFAGFAWNVVSPGTWIGVSLFLLAASIAFRLSLRQTRRLAEEVKK